MHTLLVIFIFFIFTKQASLVHSSTNPHRRLLHQPLFNTLPPPPTTQPKQPFSSVSPPSSTSTTTHPHFFPLYQSPPPPPTSTILPTFPANISSLTVTPSPSKTISPKLLAITLSILSAALLSAAFVIYRLRRHTKPPPSDALRLFPPNTALSDRPPPPAPSSSTGSSEFLYLGTLYTPNSSINAGAAAAAVVSGYRRLGSPELRPLPPLPRNNFRQSYQKDDNDDEEFFSPEGSSGRLFEVEDFENRNSNFSLSPRTRSFRSNASDSPRERNTQKSRQRFPIKLPPPPPPMPPTRFWETAPEKMEKGIESESGGISKPKLKALHWDKVKASSDRAMVWDQLKSNSFQLNEEMIETLFMVNNTNLNAKNQNPHLVMPLMNQENRVLLDPKKSQNISILLRAVNLTIDEVCEALFEGNTDTMGTELLESLLKMAPTKEEEHKLKEFKDEESPFKLGPAEKFLKALLDIPFAFKRIEAMLYIADFDSEIEYLQRSFQTLEAACQELRNSRMFMKLLEAVLKTGNRMNIGTNRGDAHAFKLDTLLKLVDIKGTDGKTTLLHFVVEEIIRSEGSRLSGTADQNPATGENPQSTSRQDMKLGLQVVSCLSGELTNVKKAAAMDYDALVSEVTKLAIGVDKIGEVLNLNKELALKASNLKFSNSMKGFLKKAEEEIIKIQAQESVVFLKVKEITEYFHGNSAKEEAHPFRIFLVVRDFLSILDRVCKEVGIINERTLASSARQFPLPGLGNSSVPPVFPMSNAMPRQNSSSSNDESLSSA
ncbi:hypothetical protein LguiA_028986 [Lonicera macranthoides]